MITNDNKAVHLGGGNYYDDLRIDISESHAKLDASLAKAVNNLQRSKSWFSFIKKLEYLATVVFQKAELLDGLCLLGWRRKWFNEFRKYWGACLGGRPLRQADFYLLYHEYRKKQQLPNALEWSTQDQHLQNWQSPNQFFSILAYVRQQAVCPIVPMHVWKHVPKNARILEYGCSLAPFYTCAREFALCKNAHWTLADIPGFAFHYAKYRYMSEQNVDLVTISEFTNPLPHQGDFDVIFLTTVLEHVDDPCALIGYLFKKMSAGGILVFDYILSEGTGLDTPSSLAGRIACIEFIQKNTILLSGSFDTDGHVPLTIVKLR
jgi:SAM-dependent methyltransferase